jgi:branched-chain amino acid transport system substrate-binding protein
VRIGAAGPWHLDYGRSSRRGIELAVEEINRGGGIRGRALEVAFANDSTDGVRALVIAQGFVEDPGIRAVVGHVNSGAMIAAAKVYHDRLAAVAPTAASPELSGISPWVFRMIASDSVFVSFLAREAAAISPRAAVLYDNNSYGRGGAEVFRARFPGTLVAVDPIVPGGSALEPHLTFYRREGVGLVYVAGNTASGLAVLREAKRQGYRGAVLGTDSWEAIVRDTALSEGAYIGMRFTALDPRPEVASFVARFRRRFGEAPDGFAAHAYDATRLLAQALREGGTDRADVREYLDKLDARTAFRGVTGAVHFTPGGDPARADARLMRVTRGTLVDADPHASH